MKATREEVGEAIEYERDYQREKHGDHAHTVGEWGIIIEGELEEALQGWRKGKGDADALRELVQVAATGKACLEQHGELRQLGPLAEFPCSVGDWLLRIRRDLHLALDRYDADSASAREATITHLARLTRRAVQCLVEHGVEERWRTHSEWMALVLRATSPKNKVAALSLDAERHDGATLVYDAHLKSVWVVIDEDHAPRIDAHYLDESALAMKCLVGALAEGIWAVCGRKPLVIPATLLQLSDDLSANLALTEPRSESEVVWAWLQEWREYGRRHEGSSEPNHQDIPGAM